MSGGQTAVDVPPEIIDYLNGQHTLTLATASPGGIPRASTFLYVSEGPTLYFWSRVGTTTTRHIEQNPVVSFAIDDYAEDLNKTRGAQGIGECSVLLSGEQIARVADLFGQKFPSLSPGSTMSISFFRITPTELQFIDNAAAPGQPPGRDASMGGGTFGAEFHRDRSFSVITDLPAQSADSIIASLPRIEAKAGETIVRQGGPADKFFIVIDGEAEVVRAEDGEQRVIESLSPGSLFGEMAIMRDQPRSATVAAKTDVKLLALERDTFRDLIAQSLGITPEFDQVIRARLDALGRE
jgi:uncharacterized protein YhbP (UPF0306 family)